MKLYSENKDYKLYQGNMLDMFEVIEPNSIDSVICDPPYELNFMNKGWDNSGIAFQSDTWKQCYEVLKPGGYLLAFGGSRTFHRIACAIEDAGFEIRDTIMWLYGSGFPKSVALNKSIEGKLTIGSANTKDFKKLNGELLDKTGIGFAKNQFEQGIRPQDYNKNGQQRLGKLNPTTDLAKQWNGWGTALKPSFEPIIVARKPFKGSLVDNVIEYGVGGINIDECRVGNTSADTYDLEKRQVSKATGCNDDGHFLDQLHNQDAKHGVTEQGRFPANTILTYDDTDFEEVCSGFPNTKSTYNKDSKHETEIHRENKDVLKYGYKERIDSSSYNDSGSASRYFYCAKASKKDRDEGLDEFEEIDGGSYQFRQDGSLDGKIPVKKNIHPTVKPTELMQYIVRLVSPNGATILDPFNGSGSTGKAVMYENKERNKDYKYIGIELTEEYLPISKARIEYVCNLTKEELKEIQLSIFDIESEVN